MVSMSTCRYCGIPIRWVRCEGRLLPLEERLRPYRNDPDGNAGQARFTGEGAKIPCEWLPEERAGEADGFGLRYHYCLKKPIEQRKRPLTRREKYYEGSS